MKTVTQKLHHYNSKIRLVGGILHKNVGKSKEEETFTQGKCFDIIITGKWRFGALILK